MHVNKASRQRWGTGTETVELGVKALTKRHIFNLLDNFKIVSIYM